jgi:hypothetical protein
VLAALRSSALDTDPDGPPVDFRSEPERMPAHDALDTEPDGPPLALRAPARRPREHAPEHAPEHPAFLPPAPQRGTLGTLLAIAVLATSAYVLYTAVDGHVLPTVNAPLGPAPSRPPRGVR